MSISVVLGEDNVLVREGVRALLDSYDDIEVVGVAEDGPSLLAAAAEHVPDVVVTDIKMPPSFQLEGIDCAHTIREEHPDTGVVVLSAHDDEEYAIALLGQGHSGLAYLDMMARGLGYADIALALGTTQEAVDRQVTDLFRGMAGGGQGSAGLLDEFKRLHAAVVEQTASRNTLASFVPQQLAERLAAHPESAIEPQEVEVTVLFSDIRGFSTIAERLEARQVASVVGRHLEAMAEVVAAHGGTIDKFQGDAVMAVFGAPESLSDHAERALRCAIAMQARQSELNAAGWDVVDLPEMGVGIGVNTGRVIAGTVGGGGRLEYTVVGDAVNIASRLQNEAAGGEIVATASTVAAAGGIACEPIGMRQVKGREEAVEVFRVKVGGL
jgi:adenylate cyclase